MPDDRDPRSLLATALKQMSAAMKAIAFYPEQHPTVVAALARSGGAVRDALAGRNGVRMGVAESGFLLDGKTIAPDDEALSGFASYLNRRGVGALSLALPVDEESIKKFLGAMSLDAATIRARGGAARCVQEIRPAGIGVEDFDLAGVLKGARTGGVVEAGAAGAAERTAPTSLSWSDLLGRFLLGQDPRKPAGADELIRLVASDAGAASRLVASIQEMTATHPDRAALLTAAFARLSEAVAAEDADALTGLAKNLGASLSQLDHEGRMALLQSSIPVPGTSIDMARLVRANLPDDSVGDLIVSMVQSEGALSGRLASVIKKVLIDKGTAAEGARGSMLDAIQAARRTGNHPPADVWNAVEELITEAQDDWISREYKSLLELMGEQAPALDARTREELLAAPGIRESLTAEGIARRTWLLYGDILEVDREPARLWVAIDQVEKRLREIRPPWLADCGQIGRSIRGLQIATPPHPPHVLEAAGRALETLAARSLQCYREKFHELTPEMKRGFVEGLEELGPHAIEPLLRGLAEEQDWEIRRTLLSYLAGRGRAAVPALLRRLNDESWYLVRNVILILGEIGDAGTIGPIAGLLVHKETRVRREAATALGKIGGPRAFAILSESLDDPDIGEVAARALATIDRQRTVDTFLHRTERVSPFGKGNRQLREAITALGELGANESVPRLQTILLRGFWLPPRTGDPVRIAAAWALRRIGTADAMAAVERGVRVFRGPVRRACSEILSGRGAPAGRMGGAA
jgi:HEAT repeat protein